MQLLSRIRFALARRPWIYWVFVACCVAIVWSMVASAQSSLEGERRKWGTTESVWVAAGDIAPGELIRSVRREYPAAMVPRSAIHAEPQDVIAVSVISHGEVLVEADVAGTTDQVVPADWVAFALPDAETPTLMRGDAVLLFGSGQRLCEGRVIHASDIRTDVAVPDSCADAVGVQIALGELVVGLTPR